MCIPRVKRIRKIVNQKLSVILIRIRLYDLLNEGHYFIYFSNVSFALAAHSFFTSSKSLRNFSF